MKGEPFEQIWTRIITHSGETFYTETGRDFTYKIDGIVFHSFRKHSENKIYKSQFEKAYSGLDQKNKSVWGSSYVLAVLKDQRIASERKETEQTLSGTNVKSFSCKCIYCIKYPGEDSGIIDVFHKHPCPAYGCIKGWHTLPGTPANYKICDHCEGSGIEPGIPKNPLFRVSDPCCMCQGTGRVNVS